MSLFALINGYRFVAIDLSTHTRRSATTFTTRSTNWTSSIRGSGWRGSTSLPLSHSSSPSVRSLFLYLFVSLVDAVRRSVLNIFIFIIEDAFNAAKLWTWGEKLSDQRPFDVCLLFDIIEQRHADARRCALDARFEL